MWSNKALRCSNWKTWDFIRNTLFCPLERPILTIENELNDLESFIREPVWMANHVDGNQYSYSAHNDAFY